MRISPPHDGMPGAVEDQITKQVVIPYTHLLIGAIFLIHQSCYRRSLTEQLPRQNQQAGQGSPCKLGHFPASLLQPCQP